MNSQLSILDGFDPFYFFRNTPCSINMTPTRMITTGQIIFQWIIDPSPAPMSIAAKITLPMTDRL
jgi:hypothetical protein